MERLTERMNDDLGGIWVKNHDYVAAADRLAYYEDMEEQGRLVVLEDITIHKARRIMEMAKQLNVQKAKMGDDQEPLITWQLFHALEKSFSREEAENALKGGAN